jgi:outer membrane protein OmpA-like peptidoglycan-associated protein
MSWAIIYEPTINQSTWMLNGDKFSCSIVQPIPRYGDAEFFHEAGEGLKFRLRSNKNLMKLGDAKVAIEPPIWLPGKKYSMLGYTPIKPGKIPMSVDTARSNRLMQALMEGMQPSFTRKSHYHADESINVRVSPANFYQYYDAYLDCLENLLPVNFNQVARTRINFSTGDYSLGSDEKNQLDLLTLYVKEDPSIKAIYIDGHTDNRGRRFSNRELSEQRASQVSSYIQSKGIAGAMITTRYHGERYPVKPNELQRGRAINRRVTVRLERKKNNNNNGLQNSDESLISQNTL